MGALSSAPLIGVENSVTYSVAGELSALINVCRATILYRYIYIVSINNIRIFDPTLFCQVAVLLYLCQVLVYSMWSKGTDPDNAAIPYLTAVTARNQDITLFLLTHNSRSATCWALSSSPCPSGSSTSSRTPSSSGWRRGSWSSGWRMSRW